MFAFLELDSHPERIANFVGMGSTIILAEAPRATCCWPTVRSARLSVFASPGRLGRPLTYFRMPGMGMIDSFYYSDDNVDQRTVSRFYGYTLEDPGAGAFRQLDPYLQYGHMLSADGKVDYAALLGRVKVPTLMVAGEADILSDVPSTELTYQRARQPGQDAAEIRPAARPGGRLRSLRPRLEPSRPARDLPADHRLAGPAPAGPRRDGASTTLAPPVASKQASASPQQ